jgi:hypothetical protein
MAVTIPAAVTTVAVATEEEEDRTDERFHSDSRTA